MAERVGIEPTHPFLDDGLATRCLNRSANAPIVLLYSQLHLQSNYLVPLVRFELTYYTPLFERGDFTKICPQGRVFYLVDVSRFELLTCRV